MTWAEKFGVRSAGLSDPAPSEADTTTDASQSPELDSFIDDSPSGLRELLALLEEDPSDASLDDQQPASKTARNERYSSMQPEYEVPISAFRETKSLEELADMATGKYKIVSMDDKVDDMPENFFDYSRRLKALRPE